MQRLDGARLGRADRAVHDHVRVLHQPGVVELERVEVEAVQPGGHVRSRCRRRASPKPRSAWNGYTEHRCAIVERCHSTGIARPDRRVQQRPADPALPAAAALCASLARRAAASVSRSWRACSLGRQRPPLPAPADQRRPGLNDRPSGSDATHPAPWRATSGRRSISDLAGGVLDLRARLVELRRRRGGDGDQAGVAELGMTAGQLAFAALDIGEAAPLAGGDPEPAAGLLLVRRLDRGQLPVGLRGCLVQRDRLEHHRHRAGRRRVGQQTSPASSPAPAASAARPSDRCDAPTRRPGTTTTSPRPPSAPTAIPLRPAAVASDWRNARQPAGSRPDGSERIRTRRGQLVGRQRRRRCDPADSSRWANSSSSCAQRRQRRVERARWPRRLHPAQIDGDRERHLVGDRHRGLQLEQQLVVVERPPDAGAVAACTPGVTPRARGGSSTPFGCDHSCQVIRDTGLRGRANGASADTPRARASRPARRSDRIGNPVAAAPIVADTVANTRSRTTATGAGVHSHDVATSSRPRSSDGQLTVRSDRRHRRSDTAVHVGAHDAASSPSRRDGELVQRGAPPPCRTRPPARRPGRRSPDGTGPTSTRTSPPAHRHRRAAPAAAGTRAARPGATSHRTSTSRWASLDVASLTTRPPCRRPRPVRTGSPPDAVPPLGLPPCSPNRRRAVEPPARPVAPVDGGRSTRRWSPPACVALADDAPPPATTRGRRTGRRPQCPAVAVAAPAPTRRASAFGSSSSVGDAEPGAAGLLAVAAAACRPGSPWSRRRRSWPHRPGHHRPVRHRHRPTGPATGDTGVHRRALGRRQQLVDHPRRDRGDREREEPGQHRPDLGDVAAAVRTGERRRGDETHPDRQA